MRRRAGHVDADKHRLIPSLQCNHLLARIVSGVSTNQRIGMIHNVLVAEPDNDTWTSLANGVRRYQPEAAIVRVKDGEQAVRYLFQRGLFTEEPETPQLILLAAELPLVTTDAVIDRLRQHPRTQSIPVIVIRQGAAPDDSDDEFAIESYPQSHSEVLEIFATAKLEKELAYTLTQLRTPEVPTEANVPCSPE